MDGRKPFRKRKIQKNVRNSNGSRNGDEILVQNILIWIFFLRRSRAKTFDHVILIVYFGMLDALLATEELPEVYRYCCQGLDDSSDHSAGSEDDNIKSSFDG